MRVTSSRCGRMRSGLLSRLIATLRTILHVASLSQRSSQLLTTKFMTDPGDQGGDGVPQQGHRGEALQQLQAQD
jgi:hypothetical protein